MSADVPTAAGDGIARSIPRREDEPLLRGQGKFVDDVKLPEMLYLAITRSPHAHATIKEVRVESALRVPGVRAVLTGKDLEAAGLNHLPTWSTDTPTVLPVETVMYQAQEVAAVVADSRYAAADGAAAVEVEYEPLPAVVDPVAALEPGASVLRTDRAEPSNRAWHWESGDRAATDQSLAASDVRVERTFYLPRVHAASIETCGCVADAKAVSGQFTLWVTTQTPHILRTFLARMTGWPEQHIRVVAPDIGGAFGEKLPVYPGYVLASFASMRTGRPVKWIEDRSENLRADAFGHGVRIHAELGATGEGKVTTLKVRMVVDLGYAETATNPSKFPAGLISIVTGAYPFSSAFVEVDGAFTHTTPGGVAYRGSLRVGEAVYTVERMMDALASKLNLDPAELRLRNFIPGESFPYRSALGWTYDSGSYAGALRKAMEVIDYPNLRREQAEKRQRGEWMGIGVASFTSISGAGPSATFDLRGVPMFEAAEVRVLPTGKVVARFGTASLGQGHRTTYAQVLAAELGVPVDHIRVEEGDTDSAPYGLGTYAGRSISTAGAAAVVAARRIRDQAQRVAAHLLAAGPDEVEWTGTGFRVKGAPDRSRTMAEVVLAAYTNPPPEWAGGLAATATYDPPNMTYPFGSYLCVVDLDKETGQVTVRRAVAVDDCGTVINPKIVDGQVQGGLTMGFGAALFEEAGYDENGNVQGGTFLDYLIPTAAETPNWETTRTVTPSPHHPIGAKGASESGTVGALPALANAVADALRPFGDRPLDVPIRPWKVWQVIRAGAPPP